MNCTGSDVFSLFSCACIAIMFYSCGVFAPRPQSSSSKVPLTLLHVQQPYNYVIHHTLSSLDHHKSCNLIRNFDLHSFYCLFLFERCSRKELLKIFWRDVDSLKYILLRRYFCPFIDLVLHIKANIRLRSVVVSWICWGVGSVSEWKFESFVIFTPRRLKNLFRSLSQIICYY